MDFGLTTGVLIRFDLLLLAPSAVLPMITDAFVAEGMAGWMGQQTNIVRYRCCRKSSRRGPARRVSAAPYMCVEEDTY